MRKKLPTNLSFKVFLLAVILIGFATSSANSQSPDPGDIIITEFMAYPSNSSEYIELYNKTSSDFDISGFTLTDDGSQSYSIVSEGDSSTVPAGGFLVLAASKNSDVGEDYVYDSGSFSLSNSADDEVVLSNGSGTEIARVNYTSSDISNGKSLVLNDIANVSSGQASISNYNTSNTSGIGNSGDKGSPGAVGATVIPRVRFVQSSFSASEGSGTKEVTLEILDPDGNSVDVDVVYNEEDSEAESGDVEEGSPVTVSFSASATDGTQKTVYTPNDDSEFDGEEDITFNLSNIVTSGNTAIKNDSSTTTLTIQDNDAPDVALNELYPVPGNSNDANGDSNTDDGDEFIEIYNNESRNVNIGGWTITDAAGTKHTFASGTTLRPNESIVVFDNSGTPSGAFGGSKVVVSDNDLSINNDSDTFTLKDGSSNNIDQHSYSSPPTGETIVRNPVGTGSFENHSSADTDDSSPFSPGTKIDATNFTNTITISGDAGWRMLSVPVENMSLDELEDDTDIQSLDGNASGSDENLYTSYDGSGFTAPTDLTSFNFTSGNGFILYVFNNEEMGSQHLPVTLDPGSGSEPSSDVTVSLHSNGDKWNLIGNPFKTAIDVSNIGSWVDNSLASTTGQIWDDDSESYILTTSNDDKVEKWQGFFVENNDATQMTIPTSAKTSGTEFYKGKSQSGYVALTLKGKDADSDKSATDKASVLYFHSDASNDWDIHDASKLKPLTSNYALLGIEGTRDGESVLKAQDSRPYDFKGEISYDLELQAKHISGKYNITWEKDNIPKRWNFTLIDNKTGEEIDMNMENSYSFRHQAAEKTSARKVTESKLKASLPKNISSVEPKQKSSGPRFTITASNPQGLQQNPSDLPQTAKLKPNYPNPFNPSTTLSYELAQDANVTLTVWNMIGQRVTTLVDGMVEAGSHTETWNASDMPSGIYIARFEVDGKVFTRKMTLIK